MLIFLLGPLLHSSLLHSSLLIKLNFRSYQSKHMETHVLEQIKDEQCIQFNVTEMSGLFLLVRPMFNRIFLYMFSRVIRWHRARLLQFGCAAFSLLSFGNIVKHLFQHGAQNKYIKRSLSAAFSSCFPKNMIIY